MTFKHRDMMAAWAVALSLIVLIASAPWDKLSSSVPPGVVDLASQRFAVGALDPSSEGRADMLHYEDSRFSAFGPEGL